MGCQPSKLDIALAELKVAQAQAHAHAQGHVRACRSCNCDRCKLRARARRARSSARPTTSRPSSARSCKKTLVASRKNRYPRQSTISCSSGESYDNMMHHIKMPAPSVLDVDSGLEDRERLSKEWGTPEFPSLAGSMDIPHYSASMVSSNVPSCAPVGSCVSWSSKPRDSMENLKNMMSQVLQIMQKNKQGRPELKRSGAISPRSIKKLRSCGIKTARQRSPEPVEGDAPRRSAPKTITVNLKPIKENKTLTPQPKNQTTLLSERWKKGNASSIRTGAPRGINPKAGRVRQL